MRGKILESLCGAALEALSPTRCASCERPGELVCGACRERIVLIDPVLCCTRCGAPFGSLVCTECGAQQDPAASPMRALRPQMDQDRLLAAAVFAGPPSCIVRAYKDGGERRLAPFIADMMLDAARTAESEAPDRYGGILSAADGIVFVPATSAAFRRRGFDHMEPVARLVAQASQAPLVDALAKLGSADQRELGRQGRLESARGAFTVVEEVAGMRLLVLDDVVTTGATASAAAAALKRSGAAHVDVLAFARVW